MLVHSNLDYSQEPATLSVKATNPLPDLGVLGIGVPVGGYPLLALAHDRHRRAAAASLRDRINDVEGSARPDVPFCHTEPMASEKPVGHRWEDWTWDASLFRGTAPYYRRGRQPYAPGMTDALADHLDLDGRGRLLDVGCGPGTVALLFARLFESVVGLDPDPDMLTEAMRAAGEEHVTKASWVQMRAEDLPGALGHFRVITFGQSFHWMERPKVACAVRQMLDANGAVVQLDLWHTRPPNRNPPSGPHPPVPEAAIDDLRRRWLGPDRRAGQGLRNTSPDREDEVFQRAGFAPEENVVVPDHRVLERSVDDVVAWVLSTSSMAPHLFGDRLDDFVSDLRALLVHVAPEGKFSVPLADNRLRIRRPL